MRTDKQRYRWLARRLPSDDQRRLVVLTGARQTGKTTLARRLYPRLRYVNLDAVEEREGLRATRTAAWAATVGPAILDEAQKEPSTFEKVKWSYDEGQIDFSVLLGSSRILLLDQVRETLAGRAFLHELWPLMASELRYGLDDAAAPPLLDSLLGDRRVSDVLRQEPPLLLGQDEEAHRAALDHLALWGGMPELVRLEDRDRKEWLRSYHQTFLERDLADLVRLSDLLPFRSLQRLAMLRSGGLLAYSDLARDAGLPPTTARRYLEYLRISFQVLFLQPFAQNLTSSVVKAPKLYFTDLGILRQGTAQWGHLTGSLFETLVVVEIHKWVDTSGRDAELFFYRTRSGSEIDLLVVTPAGLMGIEIKHREEAERRDLRALKAVADATGSAWRGGLVVTTGRRIHPLDEERGIWAVPAHLLL